MIIPILTTSANSSGSRQVALAVKNPCSNLSETVQVTIKSRSSQSYQSIYSAYTDPTVLEACSGTQTASRQLLDCLRRSDRVSVSASNCLDPAPEITYKSPAGMMSAPVPNGERRFLCAEGSLPQGLGELICHYGPANSNGTCPLGLYVATYGDYLPANPYTQPCSGQGLESQRVVETCTQQGSNSLVNINLCTDPHPTIRFKSPFGPVIHPIPGGSEVFTCLPGSTAETFKTRLCDENFFNDGSACVANEYAATFNNYEANTVTLGCAGTQIAARTIKTCTRHFDNALVSNSFCIDPAPTKTYRSPRLETFETIDHGKAVYACAEGSQVQTFERLACDPYFHDNNAGACVADNAATGLYTGYAPNLVTEECAGTQTANQTLIKCVRDADGVEVDPSFCADPNPTIFYKSPAGNKTFPIGNGTEVRFCEEGSTDQEFISRTCAVTAYDTGSGCSIITYTATHSDYTIVEVLACDGVVPVSRSVLSCTRNDNQQPAAFSFCPDTLATINIASPPKDFSTRIENGSELTRCLAGQTNKTFISRTCDANYYDTGSACAPITYTAVQFSNYTPVLMCEGQKSVSRTITQCRRNDTGLNVAFNNCSDPAATIIKPSPAGDFSKTILSGTEYYHCDEGSTIKQLVSRVCNAPAINNGLGCVTTALFFNADDGLGLGRELWGSDGTTTGTVLVADISPGSASSNPSLITGFNGKAIFVATTAAAGTELYITDGTSLGTKLIQDINPGAASSSPSNFIKIGTKMFFLATHIDSGIELWVTDGTESGTNLVKDIAPGVANSTITTPYAFNNKLYFAAQDATANGVELWSSDGTEIGTGMVKQINPGTASSTPQSFAEFKGSLYFSAQSASNGREMWVTDGTNAGTALFKDIASGTGSSSPAGFIVFNDHLYFSAQNTAPIGVELWRSDGTATGTVLFKDIASPGSSSPFEFSVANGKLFFTAAFPATAGFEPWVSDGTPSGTFMLADINPAANAHGRPIAWTTLGSLTFFRAIVSGTSNNQIWVTDGTSANTSRVTYINLVSSSITGNTMFAMNGRIYFKGNQTTGSELYSTDGTVNGTLLVKDINGQSTTSIFDDLYLIELGEF